MKGLLFTPDMARAACRQVFPKTKTRRVIVPQPKVYSSPPCNPDFNVELNAVLWRLGGPSPEAALRYCDYQPGERRCLLTTWAVHQGFDSQRPKQIPPGHDIWHAGLGTPKPEWCGKSRAGRFLPNSMRHLMPVFEITGVRAERVQDITHADALEEGIALAGADTWKNYRFESARPRRGAELSDEKHRIVGFGDPRKSFASLWDSINEKRGFGWSGNPWVWVVEFREFKKAAP